MTREKPILFSGPMVRAILAGAKTQTRRVIRWPDWIDHNRDVFAAELGKGQHVGQFKDGRVVRSMVPAYAKGDRLWVRETWGATDLAIEDRDAHRIHYRETDGWPERGAWPWRPSIFMPRWASRLTLDVVEVRVQRLQDISEGDAAAEGIAYHPAAKAIIDSSMWTWTAAFAAGWDAINGDRPGCAWKDNPWLWALTFRRAACSSVG